MRLGDWTPTWTCPVPIQHCCITCPHQATLAAVIVISAWQLQVLLLCCFSRRRDGWCMHPQSNMLSAATAVEYQWQLVHHKLAPGQPGIILGFSLNQRQKA